MGIFNFLKKQVIPASHPLCGEWTMVRADEPMDGEIRMAFHPDGSLIYSIHLRERTQLMKLTFRISGDTIVSNQPSHPQEEKTRFSIEPDGTLILEHEGKKSWLKKTSGGGGKR